MITIEYVFLGIWPISIIQDRYCGTYSGGDWLAIAEADHRGDETGGLMRVTRMLTSGPYGSDPDAMAFWADPPKWIAVGDTPDHAVENLVRKQ